MQRLLARPIVTETAAMLGKWTNPFGLDGAGMLSSSGMKEVFCLAERFQSRLGKEERQMYVEEDSTMGD